MEKRRKESPKKQKRDKYYPTNLNRQKALTIVGAFYIYRKQINNQPNTLTLQQRQECSCHWNMLQVLSEKVKLVICTGITEKHTSENPLQISNSEGWCQNVQFCGSVLVRG